MEKQRNMLDGEMEELLHRTRVSDFELHQIFKSGMSKAINFTIIKGSINDQIFSYRLHQKQSREFNILKSMFVAGLLGFELRENTDGEANNADDVNITNQSPASTNNVNDLNSSSGAMQNSTTSVKTETNSRTTTTIKIIQTTTITVKLPTTSTTLTTLTTSSATKTTATETGTHIETSTTATNSFDKTENHSVGKTAKFTTDKTHHTERGSNKDENQGDQIENDKIEQVKVIHQNSQEFSNLQYIFNEISAGSANDFSKLEIEGIELRSSSLIVKLSDNKTVIINQSQTILGAQNFKSLEVLNLKSLEIEFDRTDDCGTTFILKMPWTSVDYQPTIDLRKGFIEFLNYNRKFGSLEISGAVAEDFCTIREPNTAFKGDQKDA